MGGATPAFFRRTLGEALDIVHASDHLVMGGLAMRAMFGRPLDERDDIDVWIRPSDAEPMLDAFGSQGWSTTRPEDGWLYKAARPDVTVDLIFRAGARVELDDEHLARARSVAWEGFRFRIPAPEDIAIGKAIFDGVERRGNWYDAVEVLRAHAIDWAYFARRGARFATRVRALSLYCLDAGIDVPPEAIALEGRSRTPA